MNIKEAKETIKDTIRIYLKKDEYEDYIIPLNRQRPIFMLGAPGIGKTAIMEQIASELDIALVSYSMTHHTRQSALGLPFIEKKEYDDLSCSVSLYTMSEIIASVYETMESSGVKEGILFLDEINCVSETLYPSMLQFLQYKVFGTHKLPRGWIVVTAGNPPEFNRAVREFDVVTLDRLKVLEIDADYEAWKTYALQKGIHEAILSFLDSDRSYFYKIETGVDKKHYVTARGWEDLSEIIFLYEKEHLPVTFNLISQYITIDEAARDFCAFYDLYVKYKDTYHVDDIMENGAAEELINRAKSAALDERLSLVTLLFRKAMEDATTLLSESSMLQSVVAPLRKLMDAPSYQEELKLLIDSFSGVLKKKEQAGSLTSEEKTALKQKIVFLNKLGSLDSKEQIAGYYNNCVADLKSKVEHEKVRMDNMFSFVKTCFDEDSDEMVVLITKLTMHPQTSEFFATFPVDTYLKLCELLEVDRREKALRKDIEALML